jgi:hypothetical protein
MLATFVKWHTENYTTAEVTSQFTWDLGILLINLFQNKIKNTATKASSRNIFQLMLWNFRNEVFYYLAVKYIPVSIGIVL